jgi:ribonuclease P protein component
MLKKTERLNSRLFTHYFSIGKRKHNTYTTIITSPFEKFLCSVVVGKKVAKKAYQRNSLKRLTYSIVEEVKKSRDVKGVYIIILKPAVLNLTKKGLRQSLNKEVGLVLN